MLPRSGFDQMMSETRGFPRFLPRPGANISITIGQPLTSQLEPLVDRWRGIASKEKGTVGMGGEWKKGTMSGDDQRDLRGKGEIGNGEEEKVRIEIVQILQDKLKELGERVEESEGRFARKEWSHSRAGVDQ
jgi:monolysocardiolipin acyltransferase